MNYIKHLTGFFDRIVPDERLNPTHISLYLSLFQYWNINRFQNPISICREEVMKVSKIASKATYHKCMRELNNYGYVQYMPSYNPFKGSLVYIVVLDPDQEPIAIPVQNQNKGNAKKQSANKTGGGTGTELALVPSLNNTNGFKQDLGEPKSNQNSDQSVGLIGEDYFELLETPIQTTPKSGRKVEIFRPPRHDEVLLFFKSNDQAELDASKFFYHFESNGWKVGGKSPMKDWKAAARNWMLNIPKFAGNQKPMPPSPTTLNTNKRYDEPL
jgi:hypothetical protein